MQRGGVKKSWKRMSVAPMPTKKIEFVHVDKTSPTTHLTTTHFESNTAHMRRRSLMAGGLSGGLSFL